MFQPVVPLSGLPGWEMLNRTMDSQTRAFDTSPRITRDTEHFEAKIGTVTTAEDLVSDRRLLRVALGAFGLGDDIDNRYFIRKVLESRGDDRGSLANSLSDTRYRQLNQTFGFGDPREAPRTGKPGFGADITARFRARSFEIAVGEQDESLRLALNARRELEAIAASGQTDTAAWFRVLGTPPLRTVFETAFGLPEGFGRLDIERQHDELSALARKRLGVTSFSDFGTPAAREELIETYLLKDQLGDIRAQTPGTVALTLLQG
jgi:hypothetical protein